MKYAATSALASISSTPPIREGQFFPQMDFGLSTFESTFHCFNNGCRYTWQKTAQIFPTVNDFCPICSRGAHAWHVVNIPLISQCILDNFSIHFYRYLLDSSITETLLGITFVEFCDIRTRSAALIERMCCLLKTKQRSKNAKLI